MGIIVIRETIPLDAVFGNKLRPLNETISSFDYRFLTNAGPRKTLTNSQFSGPFAGPARHALPAGQSRAQSDHGSLRRPPQLMYLTQRH